MRHGRQTIIQRIGGLALRVMTAGSMAVGGAGYLSGCVIAHGSPDEIGEGIVTMPGKAIGTFFGIGREEKDRKAREEEALARREREAKIKYYEGQGNPVIVQSSLQNQILQSSSGDERGKRRPPKSKINGNIFFFREYKDLNNDGYWEENEFTDIGEEFSEGGNIGVGYRGMHHPNWNRLAMGVWDSNGISIKKITTKTRLESAFYDGKDILVFEINLPNNKSVYHIVADLNPITNYGKKPHRYLYIKPNEG